MHPGFPFVRRTATQRWHLVGLAAFLACAAALAAASTARISIHAPAANAVRVFSYGCPQSPVSAPGPSFRGQAVVNRNFAYQDLTNADFSGAALDGAIFIGANLTGANFTGAVFTNRLNGADAQALPSDFTDADLSSACFIGAQFDTPDAPVYFEQALLACADFSNTDVSATRVVFGSALALAPVSTCRTAFRHAVMSCDHVDQWAKLDLQDAIVTACTASAMAGGDFSGAILDGVDLYQADLQGANLGGALLRGANLSFANLSGARLVGAQLGVAPGTGGAITRLQGAYMPDADLTDADLRSADLSGAHLYGINRPVSFARAQLDSAVLVGAILAGAQFTGSLNDAVLSNAVLVNATFSGANLTNAKFDSAYLQGADFASASSVTGASLYNAAVSTAPGVWNYTEQDGTPVTVSYRATVLGTLASTAVGTCPSGQSGPCVGNKLTPVAQGPYPPQPACIPLPPDYDNCLPPTPATLSTAR